MSEDLGRPYTVKEAAAILNVDIKTVYSGIHARQIPALRVGRLILIPRPAFDALLRDGIKIASAAR